MASTAVPRVRRRRGCWWRRRSAGGGGAQALLDEAAVRFDFSQYTDVDDMVDVNGGWGPFIFTDPGIEDGDDTLVEFDATGLRIARILGAAPVTIRMTIEGEPSPLTSGPDGLTVLAVFRLNAPRTSFANNLYVDLTADPTGNYAPEFYSTYAMGYSEDETSAHHVDQYAVSIYDNAPGSSNVVTIGESLATAAVDNYEGMVIGCWTYDVPTKEVRVRIVTEAEVAVDQTTPFSDLDADFDVVILDTLYLVMNGGKDATAVEFDGWNRAFTPDEVDALIAHFTA